MATQLDAELKKAVQEGNLPAIGAIALDASGNELFKAVYGTTNIDDDSAPAFDADTGLFLFSLTKLVTSIAALQLLEQGKLNLDDPVEKYIPWVKDVKVLESFDNDGKPITRNTQNTPTILHLFTHTTGLTYDFFDKKTLQWRIAVGQNPSEYGPVCDLSTFQTPFVHEPGAQHTYGISTDYLGWVVEAVSGSRLDDYCQKYIFAPIGLKNTRRRPQGKFLSMHIKGDDGKLTAVPSFDMAKEPEVVAGGHFMTSTLEDYSQILLTVLNKGTSPKSGAKILDEATVSEYLFKDFIPEICTNKDIGVIFVSIPQSSNEGELLPRISKGWSCGLMMNNEDTPNGRAKGSGAWAGLGNCYYWLDPANGKLGLVVTELLPFMDRTALHCFDALERFVYGRNAASSPGEAGSNHVVTKVLDAVA